MNIDTSKFPPVPEGFDKWIVWDSDECPIPNDTHHCVLFRDMDIHEKYGYAKAWAWGWAERPVDYEIVAYCVKKDPQEATNPSIRGSYKTYHVWDFV